MMLMIMIKSLSKPLMWKTIFSIQYRLAIKSLSPKWPTIVSSGTLNPMHWLTQQSSQSPFNLHHATPAFLLVSCVCCYIS